MKIINHLYKSAVTSAVLMSATVALGLALSACSQRPIVQEFPNTASAREEVERLESDMAAAKLIQMDVFAPKSYSSAKEDSIRARAYLNSQRSEKETLDQVAEARAYLKNAEKFTQLAATNMSEVVQARQDARDADADKTLKKAFSKADFRLMEVTSEIEKNDLGSVQNKRAELQASYLGLELEAIQQTHLAEARDTVSRAIKEGAEKYAPRTLAQAQKSIQDTQAYIIANRHNVSELNQMTVTTLAAANHALKITREAKNSNHSSSEDTALQTESDQQSALSDHRQLSREIENTQTMVTHQKDELNQDQKQIQSLTAEQRFNQEFDKARGEFTDSEALVYQQGNVLVIRLKGLEFPISQSVLASANFPLLAKVQQVIKDSGQSSIMIEGYTDSNGNKEKNQTLSSERAEAVKQYLVSNDEAKSLKIAAQGYGDQRPLASNKTAEGRATNRRVDVIIERDKKGSL